MICTKCKSELFKIDVNEECSDCEHNGAVDGENGYIYDEKEIKTKNLPRTEADEDGECEMGSCFDNGCYIFICAKCGHKTNLAMVES